MWLACSSARATALKPLFSLLPSKARSMESLCSSLIGIAMSECKQPSGRSSRQLEKCGRLGGIDRSRNCVAS